MRTEEKQTMECQASVIDVNQYRELSEGKSRQGYSRIIASGTFIEAFKLEDGSSLERYLEFGWIDKYYRVSPGQDQGFSSKVTKRNWS